MAISAVSSQQASENELQTTPPPHQPNSNSSSTFKPEQPKQHISEEDFNKIGKILKVNEKKLPVLKKIGRKINSLIDRVHANGHVLRPELVVHEFLPDPLKVKDIEVDEDGWTSSYKGRFTGVLLHGTSGVKINSIKANVGTLSAKIVIQVPDVYLTGNYTLDGSVAFVSVKGAGPFRMNISDIFIDAFGNLEKTFDETLGKEVLQIGSITLDVNPGDMDLRFENLEVLGSETAADLVVSTASGIIFSAVKSTVLEKTSEKDSREDQRAPEEGEARFYYRKRKWKKFSLIILPCQKVLLPPKLSLMTWSRGVTRRMAAKIEPLKLPPFRREFSTRILNLLPVNGSIAVSGGRLHGLTTFARTGDIWVTYEEDEAVIEADVGFQNLTGGYDWALRVLGRGPSGSASLGIRKISAYMRIRQHLKRGSVPKLERFRVESIDHVWMDMNGLGVWDYLLELVVNTVSNVFRVSIANLLASTVTKVIQEELDKAEISFIP
ncbi:hypothetical protein TYRP_010497 [Tyrophagus putrescentiae]|nr:hypothetical protein TYRP_010497 [Tyrophagus putrescentiae]